MFTFASTSYHAKTTHFNSLRKNFFRKRPAFDKFRFSLAFRLLPRIRHFWVYALPVIVWNHKERKQSIYQGLERPCGSLSLYNSKERYVVRITPSSFHRHTNMRELTSMQEILSPESEIIVSKG